MDVDIFVENLKRILKERGISPSRAGRESGAGQEFIRTMERQKSAPSYIKVQQMAKYLGMTTSELLGEKESDSPADPGIEEAPSPENWARAFAELSTEELMQVQEILLKEFGVRIKGPSAE